MYCHQFLISVIKGAIPSHRPQYERQPLVNRLLWQEGMHEVSDKQTQWSGQFVSTRGRKAVPVQWRPLEAFHACVTPAETVSFYLCMFTISFQLHLFQWLKSLERRCQVHALPIKIQSNRVVAIKGCDSRRESGCRTMWSGEVNAVRVISQSIKELMLTPCPLSQQHRIHYHHNGRAAALADMTMGLGNPKLALSKCEKTDTFSPLSSLLFLSFLIHWFCVWTVKWPNYNLHHYIFKGKEKDTKQRKVTEKHKRPDLMLLY